MDDDPFLEVDLSQIQVSAVNHLKDFSKAHFSQENANKTAIELKYRTQIKKLLKEQYEDPSREFVRLCVQDLYPGSKTQNIISKFTPIVRQAFKQLVGDEVNRHIKQILDSKKDIYENQPSRIITTEEEIAAVKLIEKLISEKIAPERVFIRDQISYCGVLLDNNNRKVICRLHLNQTKKCISLFSKDENGRGRKETKEPLENIQDITVYKEALLAACAIYEKP